VEGGGPSLQLRNSHADAGKKDNDNRSVRPIHLDMQCNACIGKRQESVSPTVTKGDFALREKKKEKRSEVIQCPVFLCNGVENIHMHQYYHSRGKKQGSQSQHIGGGRKRKGERGGHDADRSIFAEKH